MGAEREREKWTKVAILPVKRAWAAIVTRVKPRKDGNLGKGIVKLHSDVQTCEYEDVQVMWEMLQRSESENSDASKSKRAGGISKEP